MNALVTQFPAWISPEIIPGLPFRWYGLMYLVAFGITYLLFQRQVRTEKLGWSEDEVSNFFLAPSWASFSARGFSEPSSTSRRASIGAARGWSSGPSTKPAALWASRA